jgi:hypothetical protein
MDIERNNSIEDNKLKVNPLIIGSLFIGLISILSCFIPLQTFSVFVSIIIAMFMAVYSIKKRVRFPLAGWMICIISVLISVVFMEEMPEDHLVPEVSTDQLITNKIEGISVTNNIVSTTVESNQVSSVTNEIVGEAVLQNQVVYSNEVITVTNFVEVILVRTQQIDFFTSETNELINITNINSMISTKDMTSATNGVDAIDVAHDFYTLVSARLSGLKNKSEDLEVIAEIYRDKSSFENPQMQELFTRFATVACLRYNREDLYKKYFSNTPYTWDLERRLLDKCTKCDGRGLVYEKCKYCGFSIKEKTNKGTYKTVRLQKGKCVSCRGKGVINSEFKKAKGSSGKTMGKYSGGIRCAACHGTGLCQHCHGSGEVSVLCPECSGSSQELSKDKIKSAYSDLYKLCVMHLDELANQE